MSPRILRPALAACALLALTACGGGESKPESDAGLNVTVAPAPPAPPPPVANVVAARPLPIESADARRRAALNSRDGPGEEREPEYEGAQSAATALPSQDDAADATPPPPAPPPPPSSGPQG